MGKLTDKLDSRSTTVWLDSLEYCAALLSKGVVPWLNVAELISLLGRAQGLLKSDVIALPLAPVCEAWLAQHSALREAMNAKSRALYPLKTLLADTELREHLVEVADGLRTSVPNAVFVLTLPSPHAWVGVAYAQARAGESVEVGANEIDGAALYMADFLREFGKSGIDSLLMLESAGTQDVALYQAVNNVARHYRWDAGLKADIAVDPAAAALLDFAIDPVDGGGMRHGVAVPAGYWNGDGEAPTAKFRYACIPAQAKPEIVLDKLAALR